MELCLALPADQKLRGGWSRLVMRRAMAGLLPEEVRWRSSKATLAPNFKRRLLGNDRNVLTEMIIEQPGPLEEYVDLAALRRAYDRCSNERWRMRTPSRSSPRRSWGSGSSGPKSLER